MGLKVQLILTVFWLLTGGSETGTTLNMIVPRDMAWKMSEERMANLRLYWVIRVWQVKVKYSMCAGQMVTSPTGAFTRAQLLNITTQKWTLEEI